MAESIINKFLYTGAAEGEKLATQKAVKNMPYSQIGKNILAEGAFGKNVGPASSLRGYDPKYTGKGAIPRNTVFQRMMAPLKYSAGALDINNKANNLAGGTPAQRQLYEKVLQSPVSKAASGITGALRTALSLPMTAGAVAQQGLYNLNKPTTQAGYDYAQNLDRNSISSIADETAGLDYQQDYMQGVMNADFGAMPQPKPSDIAKSNNPYDYFSVDAQTIDELPESQEGFLNPNIQPSQNMFQRAGNFVKDLELEEYLPL